MFDPLNGVYFRGQSGNIASIQDMKAGNMKIIRLSNNYRVEIDYMALPKFLPDTVTFGFNRANIQSPVNRLLVQIRWWWGMPY